MSTTKNGKRNHNKEFESVESAPTAIAQTSTELDQFLEGEGKLSEDTPGVTENGTVNFEVTQQENSPPFEFQVSKFIREVTSQEITAEQRMAMVSNINDLLGNLLETNFSAENYQKSAQLLANAIAKQYPDADDKLEFFIQNLKVRMGDAYPLLNEENPGANSNDVSPDSSQKPPTAEEMLKQAKEQSRKASSTTQTEPDDTKKNGAIAPKTASSELQQALGQAASDLITASTQAKQQRIETGIRQGYEKAKDIRVGEQLGTLLALTQAESVDVTELTEQLEKLRLHTDAQTADVVSNALKKLGISTEQATPTSPLECTLSSLPDKGSSFKII